MVVAPIVPAELPRLRSLLASMNLRPGLLNADNALIPFARFDELHFARLIILEDRTQEDIAVYGQEPFNFPPSLVFLGDFDGVRDVFIEKLVRRAGAGLREIFSCCEGFDQGAELTQWINAHEQRPATMYVNWIGRTMRQVREENALHHMLASHVDENYAPLAGHSPLEIRRCLQQFVKTALEESRLTLTPVPATPWVWRMHNLLHLMAMPLVLLLLTPVLLLAVPFYLSWLAQLERTDPEVIPAPDRRHVAQLAALEDHHTANQFSALGTLKPGAFRRWSLVFYLWLVDWGVRHVYNRGHLTRVNSIHFARWVFLNDRRRLFFASNYDGSLESYMDDFINKVAWGLNLVFTHGVGYPRTRWLIFEGAKDEQKFKKYIRRHELPTEVWYHAHPGLTTPDLQRNTLIREGLEKSQMTEEEASTWLALI